jgi:3-hydroxyethyl bacteriochlorophyllide a dehydrogenase
MGGAHGYQVIDPSTDPDTRYRVIYDVSGDLDLLDPLVARLPRGGELVLTGFYAADRISFAFTPAFMRGARIRIAAEWEPSDLDAVTAMANAGTLDLSDLITHTAPVNDAANAYVTAFGDPTCVKMILDWSNAA